MLLFRIINNADVGIYVKLNQKLGFYYLEDFSTPRVVQEQG